MAPASRLAARLVDLSHSQLLEIAAAGCEASTEVKNRADAILAAHKPLPQWAVEGVLLSSDLVPHLLAPLKLEDGAVAAVCSRWADGWKATSEGRRRLTPMAFDFPQDLLGQYSLSTMAVMPGGDELVVRSGFTVQILARDMSRGTSFLVNDDQGDVAAGEQFLYVTGPEGAIASFTHDGIEVTGYVEQGKIISCPVLAPGGLLFCVLSDDDDGSLDEIIALDAQTLQPRYQFGLSLLNCPRGMAAVGEELFVCDQNNDRIQVFSLAGEHRRSITGAWKKPDALCLVKDRLYLVEQDDEDLRLSEEDADEEVALYNLHTGRRIFVLSLLGETLQVYTYPFEEGRHEGQFIDALCYFDGRLLAPMASLLDYGDNYSTTSVVAFRGA